MTEEERYSIANFEKIVSLIVSRDHLFIKHVFGVVGLLMVLFFSLKNKELWVPLKYWMYFEMKRWEGIVLMLIYVFFYQLLIFSRFFPRHWRVFRQERYLWCDCRDMHQYTRRLHVCLSVWLRRQWFHMHRYVKNSVPWYFKGYCSFSIRTIVKPVFQGVLGTRFGFQELEIWSLGSEKIIIGSLESEKSGPYQVPNIFLKKNNWWI